MISINAISIQAVTKVALLTILVDSFVLSEAVLDLGWN